MAKAETHDLVRLAEYSSDLEAQIDAATLRSADIQVEVRNNGSYMPMPGFGITVYVLIGDLAEAHALLAIGQPSESAPGTEAEATWRRSQTYIRVRLAMRIAVAIYLLLVIYSLIVR